MAMGVYGKLPAHGDFIRRGLPDSFVEPWDAWLQAGIVAARDALGDDFPAAWAAAPAWRFRLPPGACGETPVAGVLLPSEDMVGRRFPLTLAMLLDAAAPPSESWFDMIEAAARQGRDGGDTADALLAALPATAWPDTDAPEAGWWRADSPRWPLPALPPPAQFRVLLEGGA